jgi:hypothetical protein
MKRIIYSVILLLSLGITLYAQEYGPGGKKIYMADDDRLYINKDLGVYLWISTSPDPNSKKIRLLSDSSKKYSNPMYFDTEGFNSIRHKSAVDTSTLRMIYPLTDVIFEVYADGIPPHTSASFQSGTAKILQGKKYYGSDLKIKLTSKDATSGIESLQYKLDNNAFAEYRDELANLKEGENTLEYYAIDKVGNKEPTAREVFYIDNTPPVTEYQIVGNRSDKYVSSDAVIKLTSADAISGVKATYFKVNQGAFTRYANPVPVSVFVNDESSISYYSEDNLGNKETARTIGGKQNSIQVEGKESATDQMIFEFYIDREPPQVSIEADKDLFKGKINYVSTRTLFKVTAEDEKSGVDKLQYSINNPLVEGEYKEPFSLEKEGLQYIRVKSTDFVGNISPMLTRSYYCDMIAPVSRLSIGSPKFLSRDTMFVTIATPFTLSAVDDQSGLSSIQYAIGKTDQLPYSKPFHLENPGLNTVSFSSADNVNNKETLKTQTVFVDNLPPAIIYNFSIDPIGKKNVRDEVYTIYPTNVMLYIASTDASSGSEKIEYRVNEGALLSENPVKGFVPGNYIVHVNAYDVLGNKSTQDIKFAIEK